MDHLPGSAQPKCDDASHTPLKSLYQSIGAVPDTDSSGVTCSHSNKMARPSLLSLQHLLQSFNYQRTHHDQHPTGTTPIQRTLNMSASTSTTTRDEHVYPFPGGRLTIITVTIIQEFAIGCDMPNPVPLTKLVTQFLKLEKELEPGISVLTRGQRFYCERVDNVSAIQSVCIRQELIWAEGDEWRLFSGIGRCRLVQLSTRKFWVFGKDVCSTLS
jgi:hypothetical protein